MGLNAKCFVTPKADSFETGRELGREIQAQFPRLPKLVLVYLTVNHDQPAFLRGVREVLGEAVKIVGCSAQGIVSRGVVREYGYAAGALALDGDAFSATHGFVEDIAPEPFEKGAQLGHRLLAGAAAPPKVVILHYDALCGVDPEAFLKGLFHVVECPIVGGAAAHSFNYQELQETYLYIDERVLTRAAAACALSGDFSIEFGCCHGCSPVGVELTVTRAVNNVIFELDGRRAYDVWSEICGDVSATSNQSPALAIGVPADGIAGHDYFVRAAYTLDSTTGGVTLGPAITQGSKIMLHHRTIEDVLAGASRMGDDLVERLAGKPVKAVLGFECGARTGPFLGADATLTENIELQRRFGDEVAWLGMMPWGEVFPVLGRPLFHNYSYVLMAIAD